MTKKNKVSIVNKYTQHSSEYSLSDDDAGIFVIIFEGMPSYLNVDEVKEQLSQYYYMREDVRKERRLRKEYPALKEAWAQYQTILKLIGNGK